MAGSSINVRIVRYPAFLRGEILEQPEVEAGLDTIGTRLERRGRGVGERRNFMHISRGKLLRKFDIQTAHYPRRTGWAKKAHMRRIFYSMAPNVVRKLLQRISDRWAA